MTLLNLSKNSDNLDIGRGSKRTDLLPIAAAINARHSTSPKHLVSPGPTVEELEIIIESALTAPAHAAVRTWRFALVSDERRHALADAFVLAHKRLRPDAYEAELDQERDRAYRAPTLLAIICRPDPDVERVPVSEQYIALGAAIQNILLVASELGYGSKVVSGAKTLQPEVRKVLDVQDNEDLVGFVCMGTSNCAPKFRPRPPVQDFFSVV